MVCTVLVFCETLLKKPNLNILNKVFDFFFDIDHVFHDMSHSLQKKKKKKKKFILLDPDC